MKRRQIIGAARGDGNENLRVGFEAVRFGERARRHHAKVAAMIGPALDAHQRLRRDALQVGVRQQDGQRQILAAGQVEHRATDGAGQFGVGRHCAAGRADVGGEAIR